MLEVLNLTKRKVCARSLRKIAEAFLEKYKIQRAEISLVLIGDKRSRALNQKYRNKDYVTDVLSFPNQNFNLGGKHSLASSNFLGEIFINLTELSRLKKYEEMFLELEKVLGVKIFSGSRAAREKYLLQFIFVHGLLHLIGFDDKKEGDRKKMLLLGAKFLKCYN